MHSETCGIAQPFSSYLHFLSLFLRLMGIFLHFLQILLDTPILLS